MIEVQVRNGMTTGDVFAEVEQEDGWPEHVVLMARGKQTAKMVWIATRLIEEADYMLDKTNISLGTYSFEGSEGDEVVLSEMRIALVRDHVED